MKIEPVEKNLRIENRLVELTRITYFLNELGDDWGFGASLVMTLNLVLEEAVTNVVMHGYDDESIHPIELHFVYSGEDIQITMVDDGRAYDPTLRPDPDISLSAVNRQVGGLGVFLIKKMMDKVDYQREGNRNILRLSKRTNKL